MRWTFSALPNGLKKTCPEHILPEIDSFRKTVSEIYGAEEFRIDFCYRMRIGVK